MNKITQLSLTLLAVSTLAACSGGSGTGGKINHSLNSVLNNINPNIETPAKDASAANNMALSTMKDAEAAAAKATEQSQSAIQALKDKLNQQSADLIFTNAQSQLNAAVELAKQKHQDTKTQAEVARRSAETLNLRRPQIQLIEVAIAKAEQVLQIHRNATTSVIPSEQRNIENLLAQHLTPEQRVLLAAHNVLTFEKLEQKIADAKGEVARLYTSIVVADAANNEAKKSQEYSLKAKLKAEKALDEFNKALEKSKASAFVEENSKEETRAAKRVVIGEQKIDLLDEAVGYLTRHVGDQRLKGYNLVYSGAGYLLPYTAVSDEYGQLAEDYKGKAYIGSQTKFDALPSSGTIQYEGKSFGVKTEGNLMLSADFSTKKISGSVTKRYLTGTTQQLSDITLAETNIVSTNNSATFSGVAKYEAGQSITGSYSGTFMGPQAKEVAGKISDGKGYFYEAFAGSQEKLLKP